MYTAHVASFCWKMTCTVTELMQRVNGVCFHLCQPEREAIIYNRQGRTFFLLLCSSFGLVLHIRENTFET